MPKGRRAYQGSGNRSLVHVSKPERIVLGLVGRAWPDGSFPTPCGGRSRRSGHPGRPSRKEAGRGGCRTGPAWRASSPCCAPASAGAAAAADGVRVGHDPLATAAPWHKAGARGPAPPGPAGSARPGRRGRRVPRGPRRRSFPAKRGAARRRAEPDRPRQGRLQAPRPRRRERHPARHGARPGQRARSRRFAPLLDAVPPIRRQCAGRPRRRPAKLHADKGYDFVRCRRAARRRGIAPRIARRGGMEGGERASAAIAGSSSNARWRGLRASDARPSATNAGSTSSRPSISSPPP